LKQNIALTKLKKLCQCCSSGNTSSSREWHQPLNQHLEGFQLWAETNGHHALGLSTLFWREHLTLAARQHNLPAFIDSICIWLSATETYLQDTKNQKAALAVANTLPAQWQADFIQLFLNDPGAEQATARRAPCLTGQLANPDESYPSQQSIASTNLPASDMFHDKMISLHPVLLSYANSITRLTDRPAEKSAMLESIASNLIGDYKADIRDLIEIAEAEKLPGIIDICITALEFCNDYQKHRNQDLKTVGFLLKYFPQRLLEQLSFSSQSSPVVADHIHAVTNNWRNRPLYSH